MSDAMPALAGTGDKPQADVAAADGETAAQTPAVIVGGPLSAGARLKAAREGAGLSVGDVAQRLKYSARQVQALEDGATDALPSLTFQRGFVRGYAKLLGLDANELVASLESQSVADSGPNTLQLQQVAYTASAMPVAASNNAVWPWVFGMVLAVAGIGGYALYDWEAPKAVKRDGATTSGPTEPGSSASSGVQTGTPTYVGEQASSTAVQTPYAGAGAIAPALGNSRVSAITAVSGVNGERPIPLPQPTAEIVAPFAGTTTVSSAPTTISASLTNGKLRLLFGAESWTEIRQANGDVVYSGVANRGAERWADGQPPFDLVIGNAKDVKLFYRGQEVDLAPYIKVAVARLQLK
jgi:cytoskeleton protein RodZ